MYKCDRKLFLGMELVRAGRLETIIKERFDKGQRFSDLEASELIKGILQAVAYIHDRDIIHRDLKPSNILVMDKADFSTVKIIDFGLSENYVFHDSEVSQAGTLVYMAPEVITKRRQITKSVDIWAVGIIMYEVLTGGGHPIWVDGEDTTTSFQKKLSKISQIDPRPEWSWISKNLFTRLTQIQCHQRYTAKEALQHPWVTRQK